MWQWLNLKLKRLWVGNMYSSDIGNISFEPGCNVVAWTQCERQALREASFSDALTQQIAQLVESKLLGNATCRRRRTINVVEAIRDCDILDNVTSMDHIMPSWWNLKSNTDAATVTMTTTSWSIKNVPLYFWLQLPYFLIDYYTFCTSRNRKEHSNIWLLKGLMRS